MSSELSVTIDPHVHSEGSYDGHEPVEMLLAQASDIGLDGIVVTDHDTIRESLRAAELAPEYGLVGIPGVEVSTAAGHLLAIGVTERPEPHRPLDETVAEVREAGGVAVVPHPFQRTRHGVRRGRITDCDAIEVYNAWIFTGYRNRRARQFAVRHGYPGVAASDAHSAKYIGRAYTELAVEADSERDIDSETIVSALAGGDAEVYGRRQPFHRSVRHYVRGAGRKVGHGVTASLTSLTGL
ncbi:PHP domain-containing protein [Halorussus gelatinilyticus]|uniref:PHP domain-containing protein n=1 Tax=Halorussus gelatinilyticus TaxID=2937524 RepID=A0A8U0INW3_9EURY|nr:PHP domain-containing protein [Halorussus gelatinilyticus]UPW02315.1 PHP domain-containing protein [Halorussus gelatinilyticus]